MATKQQQQAGYLQSLEKKWNPVFLNYHRFNNIKPINQKRIILKPNDLLQQEADAKMEKQMQMKQI